MSGCHGIPRGIVMLRIEERSKGKQGGESMLRFDWTGHRKKMKSLTHLIVGLMSCAFRTSIVASATVPWIPPAIDKPLMATCWT